MYLIFSSQWNNNISDLESHHSRLHEGSALRATNRNTVDAIIAEEGQRHDGRDATCLPFTNTGPKSRVERDANIASSSAIGSRLNIVQEFLDLTYPQSIVPSIISPRRRDHFQEPQQSEIETARPLSPSRSTLPFAAETVEFLVRDLMPPAILDGVGFQKFAHAISSAGRTMPEYAPIDRRVLLQELESLHTRVSTEVARILATAEKSIALSVELWRHCDFATVYAHCIDSSSFAPIKMSLLVFHCNGSGNAASSTSSQSRYSTDSSIVEQDRRDTIASREMEPLGGQQLVTTGDTSDTDEYILSALAESLRAWKISPDRILAVTTSSATLTCSRVEQSCGIKTHITCIATILNQVMARALRRHEVVLHRACLVAGIDWLPCTSENWLSHIRLVKQAHEMIQCHRTAGDGAAKRLEQADVEVISSLNSLMISAEEAAVSLCMERGRVPLSSILSTLENLVHVASGVSIGRGVERSVSATALEVAQSLSDYFSMLVTDQTEVSLLCMILDPRFKNILSSQSRQSTYGIGQGGVFAVLKKHLEVQLSSSGKTAQEDSAAREIEMYLSENDVPSDVHVGSWWAGRTGKYKLLKTIAQRVLAIPGTATPAVRALRNCASVAPDSEAVMAMRRRGLCQLSDVSPAYIQTVVFLNNNLDL